MEGLTSFKSFWPQILIKKGGRWVLSIVLGHAAPGLFYLHYMADVGGVGVMWATLTGNC